MKIKEERIENVVVGSGAAGFMAALRLYQNGEKDVAIVTENVKAGTSRNTGSDKQTYYKLSLAGPDTDSILRMTDDLFSGQCVDGDLALCEAALSARSFYTLVELGVPFPSNEYGEYMGYQTDHDHGRRATSAGPYTSRLMTECIERKVSELGIRILNCRQLIRILTEDETVYGILCLDLDERAEASYHLIWSKNVILATGGPAGMYRDRVYPASQLGSSGTAFEAGVRGKNLTEWQFGIASIHPRWNVSGTYMQALPRFVSTRQDGTDEREFLSEYFTDPEEMNSMVFLKGYQWPFDVNKIFGGSSVIDLLVYRETVLRGRRVFLDFTKNAGNKPIAFEKLTEEAYRYLHDAGALLDTPIERLRKMNEPAIAYYRDHQVDLASDHLEIAICAQHNNGGLSVNSFWETDIHGLFAIGEVCGSHGVTRPGGTALNAGQVGAVRAAECIHLRKLHHVDSDMVFADVEKRLRAECMDFISLSGQVDGTVPLRAIWDETSCKMSACAGMIRNKDELEQFLDRINRTLNDYPKLAKKPEVDQLSIFYRLRDMLISQKVYVEAMLDYIASGAGSRGSALYTDPAGEKPDPSLPELYRCRLDQKAHADVIQEIRLADHNCEKTWRPVRPVPVLDYFFENQWKAYRQRFGI